jgi:hypothetical protein
MASEQLKNIGLALSGMSAGLGGQLPQFQQVQQNQQLMDYRMQQDQQQQQAAAEEKRKMMELERQKTMFTDANAALQLLEKDNYDGVVRLGLNRLQLLQQFPGANPEDTQRLTQLAIAARNGEEEAKQLLKDELEGTVEMGRALGILETPKEKEGFSLSPGQVRFDAEGNEIAQVAANPQAASTEAGKLKQDLDSGLITQAQYDAGLQKLQAGADPKVFQEAGELRREFSGIPAVRQFAEQASAMGRIEASASDPSPAGDLSLIFNYMKVLDPGSTVREGEFANAQNAGDISDRVYGIYNRVIEGERLTDNQRKDFLERGTKLYRNAEKGFDNLWGQYAPIAERRGLPLEDALVDYRYKFGSDSAAPDGDSASPQPGLTPDEQAELAELRARYGR